jgi:hypothetical protein
MLIDYVEYTFYMRAKQYLRGQNKAYLLRKRYC